MPYTTLFFDLDGTLYTNASGLWEAIQDRMIRYMADYIGLPLEIIPTLRREYYETYGTTLCGLQRHYQVDADDYLAYVHDLPLDHYLGPSPELRSLLLSLPQRRLVFTNADVDHAKRVLAVLELEDCFESIVDVRAIGYACKPDRVAYERALSLAGNPPPEKCVLLDDSLRNLMTAHQMGFATVLVGQDGSQHFSALHSIPSLINLSMVMPELWEAVEGFS